MTRAKLNEEYSNKIDDLKIFIDENNINSIAAKDLREQLDTEYILKFRALKTYLLAARTLRRNVCRTNNIECPNINLCLKTEATSCRLE